MEKFFLSNSYYEGLLQNLYCGSKGCFSLFMHFLYQFNQSKVFFEEKTKIFEKLAQQELENCNLISQLILKLGGDNKFCSSAKRFLSGQNVDYVKNINQIFSVDIEILEMHILEIKSMILKIENVQIRDVLKEIMKTKKEELKVLKIEMLSLNQK